MTCLGLVPFEQGKHSVISGKTLEKKDGQFRPPKIVLVLMKWETWIGLQPVLVLTHHQALEHWAREVLEAPADQSADGRASTNSFLVLNCPGGMCQEKPI